MIPIRAALALLMTVIGVVMLVSFKTPDPPAAVGSSTVASVPSSGAPPSNQTTGPAGGTSSAQPSVTPSGSQYRDGTFTGQDMPNQFGDVQVKIVVNGGRLSDVVALQLPSDRARSAEISQVAGPALHDEALQAQNAQIDLLSGATYTSDSYQRSLQSALDQAHS